MLSARTDLRNTVFYPGDVIGFSRRDCLGWGINLATWGVPGWGLSHVAIVASHPEGCLPVLFESTMMAPTPCIIAKRMVSGVQCHEIRQRIKAYPGRVWLYPRAQRLSNVVDILLCEWLMGKLGTAYDVAGAMRSRRPPWWARKEDLLSLFCSELIAASPIIRLLLGEGNASSWSPNRLARVLVRRNLYNKPIRLK